MPVESEKTVLNGYEDDLEINEKVMVAIVKASELFKKDSDAIFKNYLTAETAERRVYLIFLSQRPLRALR